MSKKYLAGIAAILATSVIFAACGEAETITDAKGNSYAYVTDENNEIKQNENGDMIVAVTDNNGKIIKDDNGEIVTEAVDYPEVLEIDGYVHNKYLKAKIPEGWTQVNSGTILLKKEDTGAQCYIRVRDGETREDIEAEYMSQYDNQSKSKLIDKFDLKKNEVTVGGKKMLKITFDYTLKEKSVTGTMGLVNNVYILGDEEKTFVYTCTERQEHKGEVDFDKMISEIIYK